MDVGVEVVYTPAGIPPVLFPTSLHRSARHCGARYVLHVPAEPVVRRPSCQREQLACFAVRRRGKRTRARRHVRLYVFSPAGAGGVQVFSYKGGVFTCSFCYVCRLVVRCCLFVYMCLYMYIQLSKQQGQKDDNDIISNCRYRLFIRCLVFVVAVDGLFLGPPQ